MRGDGSPTGRTKEPGDIPHMRFNLVLADNDVFSGLPWNSSYSRRKRRSGLTLQFTMSDGISAAGSNDQVRGWWFHSAIAREDALVEPDGFEPTTSCLQSTRSTN